MAFDAVIHRLRAVPPSDACRAAEELLVDNLPWANDVREALERTEEDFVTDALAAYVQDVEPKVLLLHADPQFQIVLNHFDLATFEQLLAQRRIGPHHHHFSFSTRILHGGYVQWLFQDKGPPLAPRLSFERQVLCPTDSVYSLAGNRYHCVFSPEPETISLMIRTSIRSDPRPPNEPTPEIVDEILARRDRVMSRLGEIESGPGRILPLDDAP